MQDTRQLTPRPFAGPTAASPHGAARSGDIPADRLPAPHFITRLPLLDGDCRIVGYELLIRPQAPLPVLPGATSPAQIQDEALLTTVIDLDYQQALGDKLTLLNLDAATLANPLLQMLKPERTLLVLPAVCPAEAAEHAAALARQGFGLVWDEPSDARQGQIHGHLRIDTRQHNAMSLGHRAISARQRGAGMLIAGHVDAMETYEACKRLSFDLVQGYFFTQGPTTASRELQAGRLVIMDLLNLVMGHAEFPAIEAKFKLDAALSYKLLRFINSPAVGLRYPIKSIGQALVMLGHDQLYRWLTLLLFTHEQGDPRSRALLRNAVVRARLTEALGEQQLSRGERGGLFIAGILSMLDVLLGLPLEQAIARLKLPAAVVDALMAGTGPYAPFLQLAQACEQFDQERIAHLCGQTGLTADAVNLAHVNALIWSEGLEE
jgi:EAL and modified HD-GYP domain-containing signal transduction protein